MSKSKWFIVLLLFCISHFLQAELTVWAYKGNVQLQGKTQITLEYQIQEKDTLFLTEEDSYLALYNQQTNKIVEVKGQHKITYQELKKLELQAFQLPSPFHLTNDFLHQTGSITCGIPSIVLYPENKDEFSVTRKDTLTFHYKTFNKKDTVKVEVTTLYEDVLMTIPTISNRAISIPISKLPIIEDSIYIVNVKVNNDEKRLAIRIIEEHVMSVKRKQLTQLLQHKQLVYRVYAMYWIQEEGIYVDAYRAFSQMNDLSTYKGFTKYYQFLKKYYQGEL